MHRGELGDRVSKNKVQTVGTDGDIRDMDKVLVQLECYIHSKIRWILNGFLPGELSPMPETPW